MKIQVRIVAGSLRGRKLNLVAQEGLRPTPQMVREALFSILGNAIPDRPFFDVFAGSGAVGLEALSRGGKSCLFVERDHRLAGEIDRHLQTFGLTDRGRVLRADVYRWAERWQPPTEPVNVFVSPPFADLERRIDGLMNMLARFQEQVAPGSVLVLQAERKFPVELLPAPEQWEARRYGRNALLIWVKE